MQDLVELVDVVAAFEEGFAAEQFGEDAAYGPDVDCGGGLVRVDGEDEELGVVYRGFYAS